MRRPLNLVRCRAPVAVLLLVMAASLRSQTWSSPVAEMRLIDLPEVVDRGMAVPTGSVDSTAVLLWNAPKGRLLLAVSDSARRTWRLQSYSVTAPFRDVRVHDLDGDGVTELLLIDPPARSIRVATAWTSADTVKTAYTIACPVAPLRVLIADVTADRLPDLIVFDENEPGMHLLVNRGNRRWLVDRTVAPDLPVRDAAVAFLNNDEIPDLIAYDWVRSTFHTLYGVGSGRFLDQGVFPSKASVDRILLPEPRLDEPVRFLTIELATGNAVYWSADDVGELAERHRAKVDGVVRSAFVTSSASVATTEFTLLTTGGRLLRVEASAAQGDPLDPVSVGVPERSTWAFPIRRVDRSPADVMVISPDQLTAALLVRSFDPTAWTDSSWWSAGVSPEAVEASDLDQDGRPELLVANRSSRRLDMLWSRRFAERPPGVEVGVDAATVSARRADTTVIRFITTHPESRSVAIQDLDLTDLSVTSTTLPVQGMPEWATEVPGASSELAVIHVSSSSSIGVSLFEPIRAETYLEHTLSLSPPSLLLGALPGDADGDGRTDMFMIYKPDDTSDVAVGIVFGDSVRSMRRQSQLEEFPFRAAQRAWMWRQDLNGDTLQDLLVAFPRTQQALYVLPGRSDSLFAPPVLIDSLVRVPSRWAMRLADLDGDGMLDIIAHVPSRGGVGWWKGDRAAGFSAWSLLVSAREVGGLAIADVTGDGQTDLILTRPSWGAVTIYDAAAILRRLPERREGP
ncbi:MAG: VCBS repeat-containing protein [Bacteroidetes bacterium]|nr:VCBS repeat-containing protein [Bacteroidota bacterium]